jgi:hypothetical protein
LFILFTKQNNTSIVCILQITKRDFFNNSLVNR